MVFPHFACMRGMYHIMLGGFPVDQIAKCLLVSSIYPAAVLSANKTCVCFMLGGFPVDQIAKCLPVSAFSSCSASLPHSHLLLTLLAHHAGRFAVH